MAKHSMDGADDAAEPERDPKRLRVDSHQMPGETVAPSPESGQMTNSNGSESATMTALSKSDADKEAEVGIRTFVRSVDASQVRGLLKKRYTDFLVNEILLDGTVLHLKSLKPKPLTKPRPAQSKFNSQAVAPIEGDQDNRKPEGNGPQNQISSQEAKEEKQTQQQSPPSTEAALETTENPKYVAARDALISYFSPSVVIDLLKMDALIQSVGRQPKVEPIKVSITSDRTVRSELHSNVRRIFEGRIDSSTDERSVLTLYPASAARQRLQGTSNSNNYRDNRKGERLTWADKRGEYLHFTLYKENKDTMEVMSFMSHQLRVQPRILQFAGTKDRRAATVQRISGYKIDAIRAAGLNKVLRGSAIGDFAYEKTGLELGRDCGGNEFTVTLRECEIESADELRDEEKLKCAKEVAENSMRSLRDHGFLNYYGLQRFGTFATRTDIIGTKILKGDFRGAIDDILGYNLDTALGQSSVSNQSDTPRFNPKPDRISNDDRLRTEALHLFHDHRATYPGGFDAGKTKQILDKLPRKFSAESNVVRHLSRNPNDHYGALMNIQRNLRLMYVHAYQSLVWNEAVNERWRRWGDKVVEGDLVLIEEHKDKERHQQPPYDADPSRSSNTAGPNGAQEVDADGEVIIHPEPDTDEPIIADDPFAHSRARPLTKPEASSGQYTIFDVVLPQPGYDVLYPSNALGPWYTAFMGSERGGGLDPNDMRRKQREFSLSGGYRKVLGRIGENWGVDVRLYAAKDGEEQFVVTDLERIRTGGREGGAGAQEGSVREAGTADLQDGRGDGENPTGERPDVSAEKVGDAKVAGSEPLEDGEGRVENGGKLAIILKFQLGTSQYATMALRELSGGGIVAYKPEFSGGR